jgi:hypothetical protein
MQVMSIVEQDDGIMTIICDFTQAEIKALVELGFLKLMEEYLEKNAPFHEDKK